jgi:hypothetical protein
MRSIIARSFFGVSRCGSPSIGAGGTRTGDFSTGDFSTGDFSTGASSTGVFSIDGVRGFGGTLLFAASVTGALVVVALGAGATTTGAILVLGSGGGLRYEELTDPSIDACGTRTGAFSTGAFSIDGVRGFGVVRALGAGAATTGAVLVLGATGSGGGLRYAELTGLVLGSTRSGKLPSSSSLLLAPHSSIPSYSYSQLEGGAS